MPFSISHAVVALPLSRLFGEKLPVAALVIGAISPDFSYFMALTTTSIPSHSIVGVLIYCLFPSLLLLIIWHHWLERSTYKFLHIPYIRRHIRSKDIPSNVIAILIGAFSHVLWDASSHSYGELVLQYPFLSRQVGGLPLYKWNQYLSGILGLIVLFIWYSTQVYQNRNTPYQGRLFVGLALNGVFMLVFVALANVLHGSQQISEYAVRSSIGVVSGGVVAAVFYSVYDRWRCNYDSH